MDPAEIAALVKEALRVEREACAQLARKAAAGMCMSPRCDCMDSCAVQSVCDEAADAILSREKADPSL